MPFNIGLESVTVLGIVFLFWQFWIKVWLKKKIESDIELSNEKAILQLQQRFDQNVFNKGLYYEQQKLAYTEILSELSQLSQAIIDNFDQEKNLFRALDSNMADEFWMTVERNLLFFDDEVFQALVICKSVASNCCKPMNSQIPDPSGLEVRDSYWDLNYLQRLLGKLLRYKIGLSKYPEIEKEIAIIGFSNLIRQYNLTAFPISNIKDYERNKFFTVEDLVEKGNSDRDEIIDILNEMIEYISDEGSKYFHLTPKLNYYLNKL